MRTLFLALGVILVLGLSGASAQQPPAKQPIPAKKALDKAEDLVNDIFKDEISKANDAELRAKLAAYLLQQGDECGDDPAARYVLYRQAADLAVLAGNAKLTLTAIDKLAHLLRRSRNGLESPGCRQARRSCPHQGAE